MKMVIMVFEFFRSLFLLKKAQGDMAAHINIFYIVVMLACSVWVLLHRNEDGDKTTNQVLFFDGLSLYICALFVFHGKTTSWIEFIALISFVLYQVISCFFSDAFDNIYSSKYSKKLKMIYMVVPVIIITIMFWECYYA